MAEQKVMSLNEKLKALDKLADGFNTAAKKTVAGRLGASEELMNRLQIRMIPTPSANVNEAMGGGFPRGKTTIIAGLPDSGKTSIALETMADEMKKDPNFIGGWLESENSLNKDYICKTFGIDPNRFFFMEHEREGAGERAIDELEAVLALGAIDMMVINSLKCLVPGEEFKKSAGDGVVGTQARMNARMMRKFTSLIAESNAAFIIVTHLTTDIGSKSNDPLVVAGGNAILYGASIIMDLRKKSIQEADPITREEGVKIGVAIKKNHAVPDRNPYVRTDYFAIFGEGIEKYLETLDVAVAQGILSKGGAWISDIDPETGEAREINGVRYKWQGKDAFRQFCKANPDYFDTITARLQGRVVQMTAAEIAEIEADQAAIEAAVEKELPELVTEGKAGKGNKGKKK